MFTEWSFNLDSFIALILYAVYAAVALAGLVVVLYKRDQNRWLGLSLVGLGLGAIALLTWMSSRYWLDRQQIILIPLRPLVVTVGSVSIAIAIGVALTFVLSRRLLADARSATWVLNLGVVLIFMIATGFVGTVVLVVRGQQAQPKVYTPVNSSGVRVQPGFELTLFQKGPFHLPTSLRFGPDGRLYVSDYNGSIWAIPIKDNVAGAPQVYADGFTEPVGLAWHGDDLYVASHGTVSFVRDSLKKGRADQRRDIITALPSRLYPWHSNEGLAFGPDGKLYFPVGSTTDASPETHPYAASILSSNPDGSDLRVFATGVRNPFALAFNAAGDLFATENGPDEFADTPPDALNYIVQGGDYGFPKYFGIPPVGSGTHVPIALFPAHASADGIAFYNGTQFPAEYRDNALIATWHQGQIYRVQLAKSANGDYLAHTSLFVTGLDHPLDLTVGADGSLYIASWGDDAIYRVSFKSHSLP